MVCHSEDRTCFLLVMSHDVAENRGTVLLKSHINNPEYDMRSAYDRAHGEGTRSGTAHRGPIPS